MKSGMKGRVSNFRGVAVTNRTKPVKSLNDFNNKENFRGAPRAVVRGAAAGRKSRARNVSTTSSGKITSFSETEATKANESQSVSSKCKCVPSLEVKGTRTQEHVTWAISAQPASSVKEACTFTLVLSSEWKAECITTEKCGTGLVVNDASPKHSVTLIT